MLNFTKYHNAKRTIKRLIKDYKNNRLTIFSMYPRGTIYEENILRPIYISSYDYMFNTRDRIMAKKIAIKNKYLNRVEKDIGIELENIYLYIPDDDTNRILEHFRNVIVSIAILNKNIYLSKNDKEKLLDIFNIDLNNKEINSTNNIIKLLEIICKEINKYTVVYKFFPYDNTKSPLYKKLYPGIMKLDIMVDITLEEDEYLKFIEAKEKNNGIFQISKQN